MKSSAIQNQESFRYIIFDEKCPMCNGFLAFLDKKFNKNNAIFIMLSIPLFFLYRIYFNKKMKEDLMKIK